jgi:complex I intermediate-associated protein 30 (CIA30)
MNFRRALLFLLLGCPPAIAAEKEPVFLVDDFEDGDRVAKTGASWAILSDAIMGGATTAKLSVVGPKGSRALRVEGTIAEKGFAAVWVALDADARAVDLSAFRAIRLRLRGPGEWLVGLRAGAAKMDNFMAPSTGADGWTSAEIPIGVLKPRQGDAKPELGEARWIGVQSGPGRTGAFTLEIDDVQLVGAQRPSSPHGNAMNARIRRTPPSALASARWQELATDPAGDGKAKGLPDAVALAFWQSGHVVWFKVTLAAPPGPSFGLNLVLDVDGDPANGQPWWGSNKDFKFDRLVSVWAFDSTDETLEGTIGIANADDAVKGRAIDPSLGAPRVAFDPNGREICVGVPRTALGSAAKVRVVAAVGSAMRHNDDVPDTGAATFAP